MVWLSQFDISMEINASNHVLLYSLCEILLLLILHFQTMPFCYVYITNMTQNLQKEGTQESLETVKMCH